MIGGGVIGLEMASYFREAGAQVDIIEMLPQHRRAHRRKAFRSIAKGAGEKRHEVPPLLQGHAAGAGRVVFEMSGAEQAIEADKALVSIGRKAFTEGLGLETIGVALERGAVVTDEKGRTSVGGVFAAGDVNGRPCWRTRPTVKPSFA